MTLDQFLLCWGVRSLLLIRGGCEFDPAPLPTERWDEGLAGTPSGGVEGVASEESGRTIDGIIARSFFH